MRLARVLHASNPAPIIAMERDGALYSVQALEQFYRCGVAAGGPIDESDFRTRVLAMGGAGLAELDDRLRNGVRPSSARILPGTFTWLAPCDVEQAHYYYVQVFDGSGAVLGTSPKYRVGNSRGILGHSCTVPLFSEDTRPRAEPGIALLLGDDLFRATAAEAEACIFGYTILCEWIAIGSTGDVAYRDFATQLGPVLVTPDELGELTQLATRFQIADQPPVTGQLAQMRFDPAEAVAYLSQFVSLQAGDLIGLGPIPASEQLCPRLDQSLELRVQEMGALAGRAVRGLPATAWRQAKT